MTNQYILVSAVAWNVMDIKTPVSPGSLLQAIRNKYEVNEYWSFRPISPDSAHFYITSAYHGLAVDIQDPAQPGAALQALAMKPALSEHNQHWFMVPVTGAGRGDVDSLSYADGWFAIQNAHSGLNVQVNPDGSLSVAEPFPFGSPGHALEGDPGAIPASQGGHQLWAIGPGPSAPVLFPKVTIAVQPVIDPPGQADCGIITITIRATDFLPGQGLAIKYSYRIFGEGSVINNLGYPPVFTADFGGNLTASFQQNLGGAGSWRITVAGVSEPYSASLTTNLDAAGFFYDTRKADVLLATPIAAGASVAMPGPLALLADRAARPWQGWIRDRCISPRAARGRGPGDVVAPGRRGPRRPGGAGRLPRSRARRGHRRTRLDRTA